MMMGGLFGGSGGMGLISTLLIEMSGFNLEHGWRAKLARFRCRLKNLPKRLLGLPVSPMARPHKRVLTMGATSRIKALDPALLRAGRFDKKIRVDAPNMEGRKDIIRYHLDRMAHDESMGVDGLGGRAAEMEIFGIEMAGASNDLENVRRLLRTMAGTGMLSKLGTGPDVAQQMSDEMETIYQEQLERTRAALRANREVVDPIVNVLMEKEEIDFEEVQALFADCGCELPELPPVLESDLEPELESELA
jgi:SpoVK/Ycf46/Vps4 family AAA+-type ATPase